MSGNGYGFVGWTQTDGLANGWDSVWMAQYVVGTGWSQTPALLETYTGHNAYNVSIAANAAGDAIATYIQITTANPPQVQLWARRFSPSTSWVPALLIFEASSIDNTVPASVDAGRHRQRQRHRRVRRREHGRFLPGPDQPDRQGRHDVAGGAHLAGHGRHREAGRSEQQHRRRDPADRAQRSGRQRDAGLAQAHHRQRPALRPRVEALHGGSLEPAGHGCGESRSRTTRPRASSGRCWRSAPAAPRSRPGTSQTPSTSGRTFFRRR